MAEKFQEGKHRNREIDQTPDKPEEIFTNPKGDGKIKQHHQIIQTACKEEVTAHRLAFASISRP